MAIVFPASPSVNDTFTAGSITYKWDGDKWIGLGVTPADRLIEGSNSLEIDANNNLKWVGDQLVVGDFDTVDDRNGGGIHIQHSNGISFKSNSTQSVSRNWRIRGDDWGWGNLDFGVGDSVSDWSDAAADTVLSLTSSRQVGINTTTPTTNSGLDVNNYYYSLVYGAQNGGGRNNNTNKEGRLVQVHYANGEEPLGSIVSFALSTSNIVNVGGGSSLVNAATETNLYAAANTTTTGGTKIATATTAGLSINSGNLIIGTSGNGIDFSANANATGMTSELLNDYEEGEFTPGVTGGGTDLSLDASINNFKYIKIGKQVTIFGRLRISGLNGASGTLRFGNLPFVVDSGGTDQSNYNALTVFTHGLSMIAGATGAVFVELSSGGTSGPLFCVRDNNGWSDLQTGNINFSPGAYLYVTGSYYAA